MGIDELTTDQLREELQRREKVAAAPPRMKVANLTFLRPLRAIVEKYVAWVDSDDFCDDNDWQRYIHEVVIETFFDGKEFWEWFNKKVR